MTEEMKQQYLDFVAERLKDYKDFIDRNSQQIAAIEGEVGANEVKALEDAIAIRQIEINRFVRVNDYLNSKSAEQIEDNLLISKM